MTDNQSKEKQTNSNNVGVAKKKPRSIMVRIIKYSSITLCAVLIFMMAAGYYFLNTTSGLKQIVKIANHFSGYQIEAQEISGNILGKAELKKLTVTGNNLSFSSESVLLKWKPRALFNRFITITDVVIKDSVLELTPVDEKPSKKQTPPFKLSNLHLPVNIQLENITVENLALRNPVTKKADFTLDQLKIGIDYVGQRGKINTFTMKGEDIDVSLTGHIETKDDFPLTLINKTQYNSVAYGDEIVEIKLDGSLNRALSISIIGTGLSDFNIQGDIISPLKNPTFNVGVELHKINATTFGFPKTMVNANIKANGTFSDALTAKTSGEIFYDSPETNKIAVEFKGNIDKDKINFSKLNIDLLTAQQKLTGRAAYGLTDKTMAISLHSDVLQWPQKNDNPSLIMKKLAVDVTGTVDNFHVSAKTEATTNAAGTMPISISADGSRKALQNIEASVLLNGQPVALAGSAAWAPQLKYDIAIIAPEIKPFKEFPGIKALDIAVTGDDTSYQAKGKLSISSDTIAPSDIKLTIEGTPHLLSLANLSIDSLGGTTEINASGALSPLDISANLLVKDIKPHVFYPKINGEINSTISVTAKQSSDNFNVVATIHELTGQLQKQPLSGKGVISFDKSQQNVNVDNVALNIAGNKVHANGSLALSPMGISNIKTTISAKKLRNILPSLRGSLEADLTAKGNLKKPEIIGTINGTNLAYQQHRVQKIKTNLNISLSKDKLNIISDVKGFKSGNNSINNATINVAGKLSQHKIKINLVTPQTGNIPQTTINANGALNIDLPQWSGRLNQLIIGHSTLGKWKLEKPTQLTLSPDNVGVESLCLQQQSTRLCAKGKLQQQNGQFDAAIKQLKTKQFAKFLPPNITIDTTINGNAKIQLKNGQVNIKGKVVADKGKINILAGSGGLSDRIQKFETAFTLKNNRLEAFVVSDLEKIGTLKIEALSSNITTNNVNATIKVNSPRLAFLEELSPQLSDVTGALTGTMELSGNPSKKLNVAGKITLKDTNFNVPQFGTQIRGLTLDIFAKNGNQIGFKGGAKAGRGNFVISGNINPASRQGEIDIKGKNFQVADSRTLKVAINPDLQILFAESIKVRGSIIIPKALIVPESTGSKITASEDVVLPQRKIKKQPKSSPIDVEVAVKLGNDVRVASADIETRLLGGINVLAKPGKAPFANGVISIKTGALRVYGQQLNIQRGRIIFSNGPIINPALDIRAKRTIESENVTVGVNVLGPASKPEVSLFSTPSMPDSSILSYLLFGRPPNSDTFSSTALLQTGGLVGANKMARDIRSSTGLDVLDLSLSGVEAGKNLSKKVYVGVRSNFFDAINEFLVEYKISGKTRLNATVGSNGVSGDLIKEIETD